MSPTRRDFIWTMGTAAGAIALLAAEDRFWAHRFASPAGWAPGSEDHLASACLICPSHCGVTGRVVDGNLVGIRGNPFHPMSRGGLCPRGIAGTQMLYHPQRLASALARDGERGSGQWQEITVQDALQRIGERLTSIRAEGRPDRLAVLEGYCPGTMEAVWTQFMSAFGSPNFLPERYADGTDAVMATIHGVHRYPSYDLANADMAISFGAPLFEAWWAPLQAYTAFARAGTANNRRRRFVQVDQRFSRTAGHADEWVGIRAGTHGVLALGMAYVILRDRLYDEGFIQDHVNGFEDFTDQRGRVHEGFRSFVLRRYRTEEVSAVTGVSVERVTELARAFAESTRSVAVCGADVTHAPNGVLGALAVHSLNVLVGNINRVGGVRHRDEAPLAPLAPLVPDETSRSGLAREPVGGASPPFGNGNHSLRFAQELAAADASPIEVLLVHGTNPLGASPIPSTWATAMAKVPLVVSFSPFMDETSRYADIVLPDLLPYERWQDAPSPASYPYPAWSVARPLVDARTEGMHTGEVIFALARAMGGNVAESLPYQSFEELLRERARGLFEAGRGRTFAGEFELEIHRQREARGWWLASHGDLSSFWSDLVANGGWVDLFHDPMDPDRIASTESGRIELMPTDLAQAAAQEGLELYVISPPPDPPEEEMLRLLPYRVSTLSSDALWLEKWVAERPSTTREIHWVPWVTVAPATAEELGLREEEEVWVISDQGRYRARLKHSVGTAPGTVCAPWGIRHPDGEAANPLALLNQAVDPMTGVPSWNTTFVRLERV